MPPMSRPLMTAWATVSHIDLNRLLGFHQRRAGLFLGEDAGQIPVLPLYADGAAVSVLAVGAELDPSARCHGRIARRDVERRQRLANLLLIGRAIPFARVAQHECLPHTA